MTSLLAAAALGLFLRAEPAVRAWTESESVSVNIQFWVHLEATGKYIEMPESIRIPGLSIDPINVRQTTVSPSKEEADVRTTRRSFAARAMRQGLTTVPAIAIRVDGVEYETRPIELFSTGAAPAAPTDAPDREYAIDDIPREDLVFIDMAVDQQEVYQGEPIFFRTQLWRIVYPSIDSGPYRESRIEWPRTEGFFVRDLEPLSYIESKSPWQYDVWEERMVLFPTVVGDAAIGRWHWEGVALIDGKRRTRRQRLYFDLDAGPIPIHIKAIPPGPEGYSGAVGQFECAATIEETSLMQGRPAPLTVTVSGFGNPHAMGDPAWPDLGWAQVSPGDRSSESEFDETAHKLRLSKRYEYTLTPLNQGSYTIDAIVFSYFDPDAETFKRAESAPIEVTVAPSGEDFQPLLVADNVPLDEQAIAMLAEDMHPLIESAELAHGSLSNGSLSNEGRSNGYGVAAIVLVPATMFAAIAGLTARRSPGQTQRGGDRRTPMHRLDSAMDADDPYDAIYQSVIATLGRRFNVETTGMTPSDARSLLSERGWDADASQRLVRILETCQRARYGDDRVAPDTLYNLVQETRECIAAVENLDSTKG